jgi:hypothetical protein
MPRLSVHDGCTRQWSVIDTAVGLCNEDSVVLSAHWRFTGANRLSRSLSTRDFLVVEITFLFFCGDSRSLSTVTEEVLLSSMEQTTLLLPLVLLLYSHPPTAMAAAVVGSQSQSCCPLLLQQDINDCVLLLLL